MQAFGILEVGEDRWPFAIPIVKSGNGWFFDTQGGREELLNRRIGGNELQALDSLRAVPRAFHGYFFKILTRQGSHAPAGACDYIINGHMIGGYAFVAWPAKYGVSGITYDPDRSWSLCRD